MGAAGRVALREVRTAPPASISDGDPEAARTEITTILSQRYFSAIDPTVIEQRPIADLPIELDDPYTHFMNEAQYQKFIDEENGRYVGIGIHVSTVSDKFRIDRVFPGSPAALAGLRPGDSLVAVEGRSVKNSTLDQTLASIRGPRDGIVQLSVDRDGTGRTVTVSRAEVQGWLVQSEVRTIGTHRLGYLTLLDFSDGVGERTREAIKSMLAEGAEAVVVDLRGNPGGLAKEAVRTAEVFLAAGTPVLTERGQHIDTQTFSTRNAPVNTDVPVAVLVDGQTASSAEILAGALRDNGRAELYGSTTFGKGRIQNIVTLHTGGAFKYTYAEYLTPSGFALDRVGLAPDVVVPKSTNALVDPVFEMAVADLFSRVNPETPRLAR